MSAPPSLPPPSPSTRRPSALARLADAPRQAMLLVVHGYRWLLKPWLGNACRFEPTCSQYALDALHRHGALAGGTLAAGRLLRCHPWCDGGIDPVPPHPPGLFTRLGLVATPDPAAGVPAQPDPTAPVASTDIVRKPVP